jgi:hypothetical protein
MLMSLSSAPAKVAPPIDKPPAESKPEQPSTPTPKASNPAQSKHSPRVVEAVARQLTRPEPVRVQYREPETRSPARDGKPAPSASLDSATGAAWWRPFSSLAPLVAARAQAPSTAPDPKAEAERILNVGVKAWREDDYPARLDAYADALGNGDAAYQKQLLAEILVQDSGAFGSWLKPEEINRAASSGTISQGERASMAETFAGAYNDGLIPSYSNTDTGIDGYNFNPAGAHFSSPVEEAKATTEFLNFIDAAGSTAETREFRQNFAQYLTDSYALNDKLPVYETYGAQIQNHAAALAALVISGDEQHPELAQIFMSSLGDDRRGDFLSRVASGSYDFSAEFLEPQIMSADPSGDAAAIGQPDALSQLVNTVGEVEGVDADRLAVQLARLPGDQEDWFKNHSERADAWTNLFNGHSQAILDDLTNPDGLPVSRNGAIEPAFKDRAHDLGATMRLINQGDDTAKIEQARGHITDYAGGLKDNIAGAAKAEDAIGNGRRLGFLGAAVTDSVNQAFQDHAQTQAQKQALIGFALDLAISAIPAGSLAKTALGDWFTDHIGSAVIRESLDGFSGHVIDATSGQLTDAAKAHILHNLDEGDLDSLVAKLQESNQFIEQSLFNELPGPGYNSTQTGRENTIQNVNDAYEIALVWLNQ